MVYDNIDRLEETLYGARTTHRLNGIVIQKAFFGSKLAQNLIDIQDIDIQAEKYICRTVTTTTL